MIAAVLLILTSVFIVLVLLRIVRGIKVQGELVIACLDVPLTEFGNWQHVKGKSIWIGYDKGGFDIPDDWYFLPDVVFDTSKGKRYLWVIAAPSTPGDIYVFPFKSMEPYADANGEHYGVHPCGAYRVTDYPPRLLIDLED